MNVMPLLSSLIDKPIIRDDYAEEYLNKMTDSEIKDLQHDIKLELIKEGVEEKFPDWGAAYICKIIDTSVLYKLLKESRDVKKRL